MFGSILKGESMAVLGVSDSYYSNLVLNSDFSVSFINNPTLAGGVASPDSLTSAQFVGFYVNDWMVPKVLANAHDFTFLPIHALAAAVAIQQGKITASQYDAYLSAGANQPVGGMKGFTSYDYNAATIVPTIKQVATSTTLMAVDSNSSTTINVVQQAAAAVTAVDKNLPTLSANQLVMEKMYLAAFLRAPEKEGLDFWTKMLDDGKSLTEVGDVIFSLPVVQAIYSASMSNTAFVTAIYSNVFGKTPEADGLAFWLGQMGTGSHRGDLVMAMINAGLGTSVGTPGRDYIVNRLDTVHYATQSQVKANTEISVATLLNLTSKVGADATTITAYQQAIDSALGSSTINKFAVELVGITDSAAGLLA